MYYRSMCLPVNDGVEIWVVSDLIANTKNFIWKFIAQAFALLFI